MARERLVALDGLRGVAALAVVFRHAHVAALPFAHGYLAVDLFFLLSGFVIAKSYEPRLARGRLTVPAYMLVRLERLYPLLALGSLIGVALWAIGLSEISLTGSGLMARALASQFLLVPFLAMPFFFAFNSAHWSIVFELVANVTHAALLPRLGTRALTGIVAVSALGMVAGALHYGTLDLGWTWDTLAFGFPRVGFGFFGGVLLFRTRGHWRGVMPALPLWVPALMLLAIADLPSALTASRLHFALADLVSVLLIFPPLVMVTTQARGGALAEALGTLSFPLYAIHKPVVEAMLSLHPAVVVEGAGIIALIAVSWLLGRHVDEPLNQWRRQRRKARAEGAAVAGPALA